MPAGAARLNGTVCIGNHCKSAKTRHSLRNRLEKSGALGAIRSAEFWQWRVLSHPSADQYFILKSTKVQGVARIITHNGCRRLHLLALNVHQCEQRELSQFFASVIRWALSADVDTIVFLTSDPDVARAAGRRFPLKSRQRFAFHASDESGWEFLGGQNHCWELLDSDFEMMFESEV